MDGERQAITMTWREITIAVSYSPHDIMAHAHLELRVVVPPGSKLPVTDTGYRSHFLPPGIVEEAGGPEAFVTAWLDDAANTREWKQQEQAGRQYSLF
jgi:hypothetical protein